MMIPYSRAWEKEVDRVARDFIPLIYPCKKCSYPVVEGYCRGFRGDIDPRSEE